MMNRAEIATSRPSRTPRTLLPTLWTMVRSLIIISGAEMIPAAAAAQTEMEFGRVPFLLFQLKYAPETVDDAELLRLTLRQVQSDQAAYRYIETSKTTVESLVAAGIIGPQIEVITSRMALRQAGIVFDRADVEVTDVQGAARELMPRFRAHLARLASELPDRFEIEFPLGITVYQYDAEVGGLVFPVNSWPCEWMSGQSCLPNSQGTHFFLTTANLIRQQQADGSPGLEGYFFVRPHQVVFGLLLSTVNPYGLPQTLVGAYRTIVALDHNIAMPVLRMDADAAAAVLDAGMIDRVHRGKVVREADPEKPIVSVIRFRPVGIDTALEPVVVAELERVEIFSPDGALIRAYDPGDLPAAAQR